MLSTREEWLQTVAQGMAPWFAELGYEMPRIRMAVGFPSTGGKGKRIGECWDARASADQTFEILIRPDLSDPIEVAAVLVHELAHAVVGLECGHKGRFAVAAKWCGLEGKMTATTPGEKFKRNVEGILQAAGPLPHARLSLAALSSGPKKQKTRLLKAECDTCGYVVRVTHKWVAEVGAPHCPVHGAMTVEGMDDDELDEVPEGEG